MKRTILALALSSLAMGAAPAFADPVFDGIYAGVEGGYAGGETDVSAGAIDDGFDSEGGVGSAFAGYGKTFGNVYLGAEANVAYSGAEAEVDGATVGKDLSFGAAGRVGYLVTPDTMAYGKLGYDRARFEVEGEGSSKEYLNGVVVGGGVEHNLGDGLGLRAGVDYTKYEDRDIDGAKVGGDEVSGKAGVVFRF